MGQWNSNQEGNLQGTGVKTFKCTKCDATKTETIAKTTSHKFGAWTQASAPECDKKGSEKRTCSVCSKTETRDVKALGHNFKNPEVTKEPTCTEGGLRDVDCKRNGCNFSKTDEPIEKLGHDFGAWVVVEKPTTTKEGLQRRDCKNCDHYETKKMPKIIIKDDDGVTEGITDIVPGDIAEESNPNTGAPALGFVTVVIAACAAFIKKRQ